jgi:hypothetical protein
MTFLGLGVFFVSVWFLRNRIVFHPAHSEIAIHHSGLFGRSQRRIPLAGAKVVYVEYGGILASRFWDIGIEFEDGRREWLTRIYGGADLVASAFSEATRLPISKE